MAEGGAVKEGTGRAVQLEAEAPPALVAHHGAEEDGRRATLIARARKADVRVELGSRHGVGCVNGGQVGRQGLNRCKDNQLVTAAGKQGG